MKPGKKLIIDGDACPHKKEIIEAARERQIPVILVHSISHISQYPEDVEVHVVDNQKEAADLKIMNLARKRDLLITQDYGLSAMVLGKGLRVLLTSGMCADRTNIEQLLEFRHLSAKNRRNRVRMKGPKKSTEQDKRFFLSQLIQVLEEMQGDEDDVRKSVY